MADTNNTIQVASGPEDDARKARRRNRLQSLIGGRSADAAAIVVPADRQAVVGETSGADVQARRKALGRIYRIMTDTPPDAAGMVDGTPFSHVGVARLMEILRQRAANDGQAGAKVAAGMIRFLSAKDGEAHVHGASLERLQRVAKTAGSRINARTGKGTAGKGRTRGGL